MDQTDDARDLHELVTLEPSIEDYAHMNDPTVPATHGNQTAFTHHQRNSSRSSPIFSNSHTSSHLGPPGLSQFHYTASNASHQLRASREIPQLLSLSTSASSPRQLTDENSRFTNTTMCGRSTPTLSPLNSRSGGLRRENQIPQSTLTNVEKEIDDVDETHHTKRRPFLRHQTTATSTRVNRLFAPAPSIATSRESSFQKQTSTFDYDYTKPRPGETASLPHHLLSRGLLQGKHSDITVRAFGHGYRLHRIILDRAPFFASALSEPWCEASQKEVELYPEQIDPHISQTAFELALKRLYGCSLQAEEDEEAMGLFATACWLEMQELVDDSVESILRQMRPTVLSPVIQVVTTNYYGKPGDRILASAKAMLCRNGSDMPIKSWDAIPSELVQELVSSDGFFIRDEWSRWRLAKRLLDRRLKIMARELGLWRSHSVPPSPAIRSQALRPQPSELFDEPLPSVSTAYNSLPPWEALYGNAEIQPFLGLLDEGIHYVHMDFEQLQSIRSARDVLGFPVLPGNVIADALWSNLELRQRILNATEKELTLALTQYAQESQAVNNNQAHEFASEPDLAVPKSKSTSKRQTSALDHSQDSDCCNSGSARRYVIPSADCNVVLGGNEEPVYARQTSDHKRTAEASPKVKSAPLDTELDDGNTTVNMDFAAKSASDEGCTTAYSTYPPFRFSVAFPNARLLKYDRKVFSHTVFYAGSLWNVYIIKVRSSLKKPQLGVYLHRAFQHQNLKSGSVQRGSVDERIGALEHRMQQRGHRLGLHAAAPTYLSYEQNMPPQDVDTTNVSTSAAAVNQGTSRQSSDVTPDDFAMVSRLYTADGDISSPDVNDDSLSDSDSNNTALLDLESLTFQPRPQVPTLSPYIDRRPTIKTYFKIYSPSRGGRMLSVYESVPDKFNFSQSWGWKSSTLMVDEDEDDDAFTLPEMNFTDDDAIGADLLESGEGREVTTAGEHEFGQKNIPPRKTTGANNGLRFMVVLGVV